MKYSIKVNEVRAKEGSNIKGFATVVFGDSFKITNIAILAHQISEGAGKFPYRAEGRRPGTGKRRTDLQYPSETEGSRPQPA